MPHFGISYFIHFHRSTIRVCSELQERLHLVEIAPFDSANEQSARLVGGAIAAMP